MSAAMIVDLTAPLYVAMLLTALLPEPVSARTDFQRSPGVEPSTPAATRKNLHHTALALQWLPTCRHNLLQLGVGLHPDHKAPGLEKPAHPPPPGRNYASGSGKY